MRPLYRYVLLTSSALVGAACQPIAIGDPAETGGGPAALGGSRSVRPDGAAGEVTSGGSSDSAAGGAGVGGEPAAGDVGDGQGGEAQAGDNQGGTQGCAFELRGRVTVPRGASVVGMDLQLSGQVSASTKTGIDGDYTFAGLCPGNYTITPECGASAVQLELDENQTLDFINTASGCDTDTVEPRLLLVILDPTATPAGVNPPARLSTALGLGAPPDNFGLKMMDALTAATNGHVRPNGRRATGNLEFPPFIGGFRYTPETFAKCLSSAKDCRNDSIDYAALDLELGLCDIVQSENIDQVWVFGVDKLNLPRVGALSCPLWVDGSLSTQVLDVFGLRYDRGVSSFLADLQAAADAELWSVFPNVPGDPINNPYGLFQQACGSVSLAPNSKEPGRFDDAATVESFCDAFLRYPLSPRLPLESLSCAAWGCTEDGFRRYWFSRLPRARWLDSLGRPNDFWRSVLLNRHVATPDIGVSCSSSDARGSCEHVRDGQHGVCGVGEWGLQDQAKGWVEFQFSPPRWLNGVDLYDRACDAHVLAGHLEFSDGSEEVPFEALELGAGYTGLTFAPKLLSGLRVYIDQSSGQSPGFGEVSLRFAP